MKLTPFPQARLQLTRISKIRFPSGSSARAVPAGVSSISFDPLESLKIYNALQPNLAAEKLID